jgi:hypothetical protein
VFPAFRRLQIYGVNFYHLASPASRKTYACSCVACDLWFVGNGGDRHRAFAGLAAVFSLLGTVIPLVYRSSKTDATIAQFVRLAGEFTNLRDRFRQLSEVGVHKDVTVFDS